MKVLFALALCLLSSPALRAADLSPAAGVPAGRGGGLEIVTSFPLSFLEAMGELCAKPVKIGGKDYLLSLGFDGGWNDYFSIKPAGTADRAGMWPEKNLKDGVVYSDNGFEVRIKQTDGAIALSWDGGSHRTSMAELFDLLYANSPKIVFTEHFTYAVSRAIDPRNGFGSTIALRRAGDGRLFYSQTYDMEIDTDPKWLLDEENILYGVLLRGDDLRFVTQHSGNGYRPAAAERQTGR
ncbi:MAG: hypothetical protein WCK76_01930 [Elusimicrobiota bacterium]